MSRLPIPGFLPGMEAAMRAINAADAVVPYGVRGAPQPKGFGLEYAAAVLAAALIPAGATPAEAVKLWRETMEEMKCPKP